MLQVFTNGLYFQFVVASFSCMAAGLYHYGLYREYSDFLGWGMDDWRSFDVGLAVYGIALIVHYLVNADHPVLSLTSRVGVPCTLVGIHMLGGGTLADFAKVLAIDLFIVVLGRACIKPKRVPVYDFSMLKVVLPNLVLAFAFFPMPVVFPRLYWLYHSLW